VYKAHLLSVGGDIPPSEYSYFHNGKCEPFTAFKLSERGKVLFRLPRVLGCSAMYADFFTEGGEFIKAVKCKWQSLDGSFDLYSLSLPIRELGVGLYFYRPRIISSGRELFGKRNGGSLIFGETPECSSLFQLTVSDFAYAPPEEMYGGII